MRESKKLKKKIFFSFLSTLLDILESWLRRDDASKRKSHKNITTKSQRAFWEEIFFFILHWKWKVFVQHSLKSFGFFSGSFFFWIFHHHKDKSLSTSTILFRNIFFLFSEEFKNFSCRLQCSWLLPQFTCYMLLNFDGVLGSRLHKNFISHTTLSLLFLLFIISLYLFCVLLLLWFMILKL
jgi:hypothetical protein